jgi:hypothetical protein
MPAGEGAQHMRSAPLLSTRLTASPVRSPTLPRSSRSSIRRGVSFVSVTQQFNTTSSMGRLTLNVLLSFAQFEREVTGERIRDKIAASKKKGMWMGGVAPLGYDVKDRQLIVNPQEAKVVGEIFSQYLRLGSVAALKQYLDQKKLRTKVRTSTQGRVFGGKPYSRGENLLARENEPSVPQRRGSRAKKLRKSLSNNYNQCER